jgi:ATP-dependent helicase/nuclease subunit A
MTVHAAKGLEFPIVFVTHLTRGTGGRGDPVVIVPAGPTGRTLVSVGGSLAEAGAAVQERDREETKRLLYVAVTRARERLYLAAVLKHGKFRPGTGSLAEVLPPSLRDAFVQAAKGAGVEWRAESGGVHALRVVAVAAQPAEEVDAGDGSPAPGASTSEAIPPGDRRPTDFGPLADAAGQRRVAAAGRAMREAGGSPPGLGLPTGSPAAAADAALVGTVVHRLFQSADGRAGLDQEWLARQARAYLTMREEAAGVELDAVVDAAVAHFLALRARPDVAALLEGATCHYEVPFSVRLAGDPADGTERDSVIRGSIDCLAILPDGRIRVVELKTGRPQSWHAVQLDTYVRAVRALFPGAPVDGQLIYP